MSAIAPVTRLWTVEEYHRMAQTGIISPDERVELIEGEVISMAVADATLKFDTGKKAVAYARSQIADYWVVDVIERRVYIFRKPVAGAYIEKSVLNEHSTIKPLAFPEIEVALWEFFP